MSELRVLHLADVHFDATFKCRSADLRARLRGAIRESFCRAVDIAIERNVDVVLIAGDLFDGDRLSFVTEKLIFDQCRRLQEAGIPMCYATGNHDPALEGARQSRIQWPDNVKVFGMTQPEEFRVVGLNDELKGIVVGCGHEGPAESANLAASFPIANEPVPHVGLLHTMVTAAKSTESHDRFAPCTMEDLRRTDYDYWALGHIHLRQTVDEAANAFYSGNLLGRNPRETGPKGALLVDVQHRRPPQVAFVPLAPIEWVNLRPGDLSSVSSVSELGDLVLAAFRDATAGSGAEDWVVVVDVDGECPLAVDMQQPEAVLELEDVLAGHLGVSAVEVRTENLRAPIDVDVHRDEPHILGEVLALISEAGENRDVLLQLCPEPMSHGVKDAAEREAYLRRLLTGLDREAVRRLLLPAERAR